ncbi:uncharacterized protein LOC107470364 [Arachis duranensis]|uniref:Uncharacterized protein LOC107470364 n=1 Tax=Arachis duranensis TaxID=130453 RepID=A0A6P4BNM6_ARADU|nr:uncharacterized protein LOC107470364 [Arachis duranensis]
MDLVGDDVNVDEIGDIDWEKDNNDGEEEFEANYEVDDENKDGDLTGESDVAVEDGEFSVEIEFGSRDSVISVIKRYTISRGVDYTVYESELQTFYTKCKGYSAGCDWLIRANLIRKKECYTIRPLVEVDPSIKVKSIIAEVQSMFNYTVSYRKAWLAKQKPVAKFFGDWEVSYQILPVWLKVMTEKIPRSCVQIKTLPVYHENEVDGTHLYGKYKGPLLVAVAQDGNQNIVPIAILGQNRSTTKTTNGLKSEVRHILNGEMRLVLRDGCWHLTGVIIGDI